MKLFPLFPLLSSMANIILGTYIKSKNPNDKITNRFFWFVIAVVIWSFAHYITLGAPSEEFALILDPLGIFGAALTGTTFLHFIIEFTKTEFSYKKIITKLLYIPPFLLMILTVSTDWINKGAKDVWWGFFMQRGELYHLHTSFVVLSIFAGLIICVKYIFNEKDINLKKQAIIILIGLLTPFTAGLITEVLAPTIDLEIPPLSTSLAIVESLLMAYAITKYGFLSVSPEAAASSIIKTINDYLIVFNKDNKISFANNAALELLGYTKEEMLNKNITRIFPKTEVSKIINELKKYHNIEDRETNIKCKNNYNLQLSINGSVIKKEGKNSEIIGYVLVMRDISEYKGLIRNLKKNKKHLEKANKEIEILNTNLEEKVEKRTRALKRANTRIKNLLDMKSKFVNQVAHDLRTPLTPLSILLPLIKNNAKGKLSKKDMEKIDVTINNTKYLQELVTDTLNISRIDAGKAKFNIEKLNIYDLTREIIKNNEVVFKKEKIKIKNKLNKRLPSIKADKIKTMEVISNLISNAIKFMPSPNKEITFDAKKKGEFIEYSVRDTGLGIEKDDLKKVFDEFNKVNRAKDSEKMSFGLGLSICKRFIALQGGKIWAESKGKNKGTTIKFTIPIHQ